MWGHKNNISTNQKENTRGAMNLKHISSIDLGEVIKIKKARYKERIKVLYKTPRSGLSMKDKQLFQLSLRYRLKGSIAGITPWIERAEMLFQQHLQKEQEHYQSIITW